MSYMFRRFDACYWFETVRSSHVIHSWAEAASRSIWRFVLSTRLEWLTVSIDADKLAQRALEKRAHNETALPDDEWRPPRRQRLDWSAQGRTGPDRTGRRWVTDRVSARPKWRTAPPIGYVQIALRCPISLAMIERWRLDDKQRTTWWSCQTRAAVVVWRASATVLIKCLHAAWSSTNLTISGSDLTHRLLRSSN